MENTKKQTGIKTIALLILPGVQLLDVAGPCDVFMSANFFTPVDNAPKYQVQLISSTPDRIVYSNAGIPLTCSHSIYDHNCSIDTLLVAGTDLNLLDEVNPDIYHYLQGIATHVRRIGSVCVGAFVLAKAGLLEGKQVTTHWKYAAILQRTYPDLDVNVNPFFIHDQGIYTSGGVSSGIDLALALLEEDCGKPLASEVAKHLVLHLKRPGGQSQFGDAITDYDLLTPFTKAIRDLLKDKLGQAISIDYMAESLNMSVRNFSRVFLKESGMTPGKFLEKMRLDQAKNMVEYTDMSFEMIAQKCGFGNVISLRRLFLKYLSISPLQYRKTCKGTE
ncbi:GlxA family transcriptional regulator [Sphingobacterium athyrii]|uniref:AraC family transcriptional regulator n=1 Tax=Sphingobacterium athyrii TaxID=2152717 RepID=A0A363NWR1_9SPHI|nr:helix-turn-helix domain-containing protein [Sphingobacterium athyrii]PUV25256.1 AraC family transcriptional regulator [Sphingobacterium athyrii]